MFFSTYSFQSKTSHSQRRHISPTWEEAEAEPICTEICAVVAVPDMITCAKFWTEMLRG